MPSTFIWFLLSPNGRASRQEVWLGYIGLVAALAFLVRALPNPLFYNTAGRTWHREDLDLALRWPAMAALLIVGWPLITVFVKRLHDLNLSGWWMTAMLALPPLSKMLGVNLLLLCLVSVLVLGIVAGTPGDNRYGSDPVARRRP
ncbi:MAG: DUF805 domain-containing protein [Bradyrhizobium guangdongense]